MFNLKATTKIVPFGSQSLNLTLKSVKTSNPGLFWFSQGSESLTTSEQMGQSEGEQHFFSRGSLHLSGSFTPQKDICRLLGWKDVGQTEKYNLSCSIKMISL